MNRIRNPPKKKNIVLVIIKAPILLVTSSAARRVIRCTLDVRSSKHKQYWSVTSTSEEPGMVCKELHADNGRHLFRPKQHDYQLFINTTLRTNNSQSWTPTAPARTCDLVNCIRDLYNPPETPINLSNMSKTTANVILNCGP